MTISKVRIENFRSIKKCEFRPGSLCALVGENNAGKSNILRALNTVLGRDYVSAASFEDKDFFNRDLTSDILIEVELDPPPTYRAFKHAEPVEIPIVRYTVTHYKVTTEKAKKGDRRLQAECLSQNGKPVSVLAEAPHKGKQHKYTPLVQVPAEVRQQLPVIFIGTDRRLERQLPFARGSLLRRLLEDVDVALKESVIEEVTDEGTTRVPALEVFRQRLESALEVLRTPEFNHLEEILRTKSLENLGYDPVEDADRLKFHFGLFDSLEFYKAIKLLFREGGLEIEATDMGAGAQNALVVAIVQAYESLRRKGAVFLIEEPEMYLYPHRQRFFFETLRSIAQTNQIIYSTHSTNFVSIPDFEKVHVVHRDTHNTTKVTSSRLTATDQLREKLIKEFDPERNELFFANHVILVEGDTEKLALPEYAKRLGINLSRVGCSIIEVGGKRSLRAFADIVSSFGIPITIVFDSDSSDFLADQKGKEARYNADLRSLANSGVAVVELNPKYEKVLALELGEEPYQKICQKYPGYSKAVRARLIAADTDAPIPSFAQEILGTIDSSAAQ